MLRAKYPDDFFINQKATQQADQKPTTTIEQAKQQHQSKKRHFTAASAINHAPHQALHFSHYGSNNTNNSNDHNNNNKINNSNGNSRYNNQQRQPPFLKNHGPRLKASAIRPAPGAAPLPDGDAMGAYTQRALYPSTPGPTQNPLLRLSHPKYDLPERLTQNLRSLGIDSIYPWQASCLLGRGLLEGTQNLVYTAPTGGGKSLVADVLMFRRVLAGRKALLVLPYVALVQEKLRWLRRALEGVQKKLDDDDDDDGKGDEEVEANASLGQEPEWKKAASPRRPHRRRLRSQQPRVAGYFGGSQTRENWADVDLAVCTMEKANGMVNAAIEAGSVDELGIVVLDELHMIDDEHRGYLLELMATKLLTLQSRVQIVGMSATLQNSKQLATWLRGKYYESRYKPVPIEEFLVYENKIFQVPESKGGNQEVEITKQLPVRIIEPSADPETKNDLHNAVVALAIETATSGYGALIFCHSRASSQATAEKISRAMPTASQVDPGVMVARHDVVLSLRSIATLPLDERLASLVLTGVAFHHAGLTTQERDIVSAAYDTGALKVIVATCSLAAGINLPARRVILQGARMGRELVGPAMLRQMRGRAGRKGKDELGESYVCVRNGGGNGNGNTDLQDTEALIFAELPPLASGLLAAPGGRGLRRALLEAVAVRLVASEAAIRDYMRCTLLFHTSSSSSSSSPSSSTEADADKDVDVDALAADALDYLQSHNLITSSSSTSFFSSVPTADNYHQTPSASAHAIFAPTPLGAAIVAAGLPPADGLTMYAELSRALRSFVMESDLHAFFLFTPYSASTLGPIHWEPLFDALSAPEFSDSDAPDARLLPLLGINPGLIVQRTTTGPSAGVGEDGNYHGESIANLPDPELRRLLPYARFAAALQLRALCAEVPVASVARAFRVERGHLQSLLQSAQATAGAAIALCMRLSAPHSPPPPPPPPPSTTNSSSTAVAPGTVGWGMLSAVLTHMRTRLHASARADLLELARVPFVKGRTARALWEAGIRDLRDLAEADEERVVDVLVLAQPQQQQKWPSRWQSRPRRRRGVEEAGGMGYGDDEDGDGGGDGGGDGEDEEAYREKLRERARIMVRWAGRTCERERMVGDGEGEYEE